MASTEMDVWVLLWALLGGTAVGVLAKWLAPVERSEVPLWLVILTGIAGVFLGDVAYTRFYDAFTPGVDWWRHGWQIAAATVLVGIAARITGRRRT